jgi:arylsulfatase A-like enzyme
VSGVDILPTLADLAGYSERLPSDIDGGSLREVAQSKGVGNVRRNHPFLVFHQGVDRDVVSAIRLENYKLVKTWRKDRLELFDLDRDIGETVDLSEKMKSKTDELHGLLKDYLTGVNADTRASRKEGKQR